MAELHVVPRNDLIEHDTSSDDSCVCAPRREFMNTDDVTGWLVVHHSLDGRELAEAGK